MGSLKSSADPYDIVVIGAGLAGINCAYRLQTQIPNARFTILEARDNIGGTWDLFKYPGIRSDSDLHTYGFAWEPWPYETPIAQGPLIMSYLHECVQKYGLSQYLNFRHKVVGGDWSSEAKKWTLTVDNDGDKKYYETSFVVLATGYYDYETPLETTIPGLEKFQGKVIHPQFWPTDYDFSSKEVVVVGSGATAITLIPNLAPKTKHVTMLQRSPGYIVSVANHGPLRFAGLLPKRAAATLNWLYYTVVPFFKVLTCLAFPEKAKKAIIQDMDDRLPANISTDPHFTPRYYPWRQRVCLSPDGDFFACLHGGKNGEPAKADVVTGEIETVTEDGIVIQAGKGLEGAETRPQKLHADVIVTSTGLKMCWGGKIPFRVDGELVQPGDHVIWNGCMVSDVPNLMFMVGYAWASWTLGVDNTAITLCRMWKDMQKQGKAVAVPKLPAGVQIREEDKMPWLTLTSTYIKKASDLMPFNLRTGKGPWKGRGNIWVDWIHARYGDIKSSLSLY